MRKKKKNRNIILMLFQQKPYFPSLDGRSSSNYSNAKKFEEENC